LAAQPGDFAEFLESHVQRQGREAEGEAMEMMTVEWLQLMPLLVQACQRRPQASAFLQDLFQVGIKYMPCAESQQTSSWKP